VSRWPATKARRVYAALGRIGWSVKALKSGSHTTLTKGTETFVWSFHEDDEIGPKMLARIAKKTGLTPDDL